MKICSSTLPNQVRRLVWCLNKNITSSMSGFGDIPISSFLTCFDFLVVFVIRDQIGSLSSGQQIGSCIYFHKDGQAFPELMITKKISWLAEQIQACAKPNLSEGVPHEVLGHWVRWERGQVIPDLSRGHRAQKIPKHVSPSNVQNSFPWTRDT